MKTPEQQRFSENYKLIYHVLNKYFPAHQSDEDITQEGAIGLWKACRTHDASKGVAFSTYAVRCIRNEIGHVFTCANYPKRTRFKTNYLDDMTMPDSTPFDFITYQTPGQLSETEAVNLKIDFDRFRKALNREEKEVVDKLKTGYNPVQISKKVGVSYQTIYNRLHDIRYKAMKAGLRA